jgi:hypothetical protein
MTIWPLCNRKAHPMTMWPLCNQKARMTPRLPGETQTQVTTRLGHARAGR